MKEAIVILTLMGCDHSENNCDYIETASQTYGSELACLRASEDQILGLPNVEYPIVMADCAVQTHTVASSDVEDLLENELHEPDLSAPDLTSIEEPHRPISNTLGNIKNVSSKAVASVWKAAVTSTAAINPF